MSDANSRLGRNALIYGLAFVLQRAVSFIMLPVYTRYLVPEDYATLQLLQMTLDVTTITLAAGTTAGIYRFYFKASTDAERRGVVASGWLLLLGFNLLGALGLWLAAPWIAGTVLEDPSATGLVYIVALSFVLDPCLTAAMLLMQIRERSALHTGVSLTRLLLQLSLNIVFVVVLEAGVRGILLSTLITYVVLAVPLMIWFFRQIGLRAQKAAFVDLFRFGLPYRLTGIGEFVLTYVDRYFLLAFTTLHLTGLYALAYQFGFLLVQLAANPFLMAWNPQRHEMAKSPKAERDAFYNRGFRMQTMLLAVVAVGIANFVGPMLILIADPAYHSAALYVPVIVIAYLLQTWTQVVEFAIQVSEKTSRTAIAVWISVAVVVALYAVLIPPYGAHGAAIATLGAFAARFAAMLVLAQRVWPIAWHWATHIRLLGLALAAILTYALLRPEGLWPQIAVATGVQLVFMALAWRLGGVPEAERAAIIAFVQRLRRS